MNTLLGIVVVVQVVSALIIIGLVLLQHGKGADMSAAFGSGTSGSLFGVSGSANFLSRATAIAVAVFFVTSITLAYISGHKSELKSVVKGLPVGSKTQTTAPVKPTPEVPAVPNN